MLTVLSVNKAQAVAIDFDYCSVFVVFGNLVFHLPLNLSSLCGSSPSSHNFDAPFQTPPPDRPPTHPPTQPSMPGTLRLRHVVTSASYFQDGGSLVGTSAEGSRGNNPTILRFLRLGRSLAAVVQAVGGSLEGGRSGRVRCGYRGETYARRAGSACGGRDDLQRDDGRRCECDSLHAGTEVKSFCGF